MNGPLEIRVGKFFTLRGAPGEPVTVFDGDLNVLTVPAADARQLAEALLAFTVEEPMQQKQPTAVECRTCRALIFFALTPAGRRMPINAKPDPAGLLIGFLTFDSSGRAQLNVDTYRADEPKHQGRNRWTSHFATCAQADQHRRGT
jgi:hypothetical protein